MDRKIQRAMDVCNSQPHPISDMAWRFYQEDPERYRIGAAMYYTGALSSANAHNGVHQCMFQRLNGEIKGKS